MSSPPDRWNTKTDAIRTQLLVMRWQDGESAAMDELVGLWHERLRHCPVGNFLHHHAIIDFGRKNVILQCKSILPINCVR